MDIPGSAAFNNQSTITNPLSNSDSIKGQQTPAQQQSETANTTVRSEQAPTALTNNTVVNEATETVDTTDAASIGRHIDVTV